MAKSKSAVKIDRTFSYQYLRDYYEYQNLICRRNQTKKEFI